jgi:hypothetical protein
VAALRPGLAASASNEEIIAAAKAKRLTVYKLHLQLRTRSNHDLNGKAKHQWVRPHDLIPYRRKIEPGTMRSPAPLKQLIDAICIECHALAC